MHVGRLLSIALLLFGARAFAQVPDNRLGLSRHQILAMGDNKWFDYYAKKMGESTEALATACQTYADALHGRNEERLHYLTAKDRLQRWYAGVKEYGDAMFRVQSRNGGTVWTAIEAAQAVDIEELLDRLENLEVKPDRTAPPDLQALAQSVLAHHDAIEKKLDSVPLEPLTGIGRVRVAAYNNRGRAVLHRLIPELVKFDGQEAYAVFTTCSKLSDPGALFLSE